MTIPFSFPQLGNSSVQPLGTQTQYPDLGQSFLQAFLGAQQEKGRNSRSSAELDLQKQEMAFRIAQEKTKQEGIKHQQEVARQQGEATRLYLETILPHMAQTGAINQLVPQAQQQGTPFTPQGGAGQPLPPVQQTPSAPAPAPPDADTRLQQYLATMAPEAASAFVQDQLPHLLAMRKGSDEKGQAIQTGEMVTTFVPGKGFWDPKAQGGKGGYVQTVERGMSADEKQSKALDRQLREEQIAALRDSRTAMRAQVETNQFNGRTKDLRDRARIIMQAQQTIGDAMHNPDEKQRRVLYSSAIANFVQAADQKAQLRYQLLNYFKKNIDPSIGGSWNTLKDRMLSGSLPKYVGEGMLAHIGNLLQMSRSEYEKHRAGEIKRHPDLANWLPEADEYFTNDMQTTAPGAAPSLPPIP